MSTSLQCSFSDSHSVTSLTITTLTCRAIKMDKTTRLIYSQTSEVHVYNMNTGQTIHSSYDSFAYFMYHSGPMGTYEITLTLLLMSGFVYVHVAQSVEHHSDNVVDMCSNPTTHFFTSYSIM